MQKKDRYLPSDRKRWPHIWMASAILFLFIGQPGLAQTFDSGSDGSDGALDLTEPGEILFDPRAFAPPLDQDGDNVYHFTTINIASGVTVRMTATLLNNKPVIWLASGAVTISGILDLSGQAGHPATSVPAERRPSEPGPGGFAGGIGGFSGGGPPQPGSGPGGGDSGLLDNFLRGAGGSFGGNSFLVPLFGGSGGGGGGSSGTTGYGGGAGGGAILVASSTSVEVNGRIHVNGGDGSGSSICCNFGGSGSGGAIRLVAPVISGSGVLDTNSGFASRRGSRGRVRLEAFQQNFSGTVTGNFSRASPFGLFLETTAPSVRVVRVAGEAVPPVPAASFVMPDVTIVDGGIVVFEIEAENVPLGTIVKLHLFSENDLDQTVDSTPLAGTEELSTATASLEVPPGFSRSFVRVTFEPPP